jgi:putative flippase GtrA
MSKWRSESAYFGRYAGSGALNTVAGFAVIFLLMELGASPLIANVGGYLAGLILGFFVSKRFVFRSGGHISSEGLRYLAAFIASFILNLLVLQFALDALHWSAIPAQLLAAAAYTSIMYLLTRWLVFRAGMISSHLSK